MKRGKRASKRSKGNRTVKQRGIRLQGLWGPLGTIITFQSIITPKTLQRWLLCIHIWWLACMNKNTTPRSPLSTHGPEGTSCWCQPYIISRTMPPGRAGPTKWITRWDPIRTRGKAGRIKIVSSTVILCFYHGGEGGRGEDWCFDGDGDYECAWHSTPSLNLLRQQREYDDDFRSTLSSLSLSPSLCQSLHTFLKKRNNQNFR